MSNRREFLTKAAGAAGLSLVASLATPHDVPLDVRSSLVELNEWGAQLHKEHNGRRIGSWEIWMFSGFVPEMTSTVLHARWAAFKGPRRGIPGYPYRWLTSLVGGKPHEYHMGDVLDLTPVTYYPTYERLMVDGVLRLQQETLLALANLRRYAYEHP